MLASLPQQPDSARSRSWYRLGAIGSGLLVLVVCGAIRWNSSTPSASADEPAKAPKAPGQPAAKAPAQPGKVTAYEQATRPAQAAKLPSVVASVNNQQISLNDLAAHCLRYFGEDVLESLVNKRLIEMKCKQLNISVTRQEIDEEILRMATRFKVPIDRWLTMLEQERGIRPDQYRNDIVWPTLALKKLAAKELNPTKQEMQQAYETQYGPAVRARLIAVEDRKLADELRAKAVAKPDEFGSLAKEFSQDAFSASMKGMIQPIRMHTGDETIEKVAFSLQEGDISPVIQAGPQFVILKCEGRTPDRYQQFPPEKVFATLQDSVREAKLRDVSADVFTRLQKEGNPDIVYQDAKRRKENPNVAAIINGQTISTQELMEACVHRHGIEVLQGMINRTLILQECQKLKVEVTEADVDAEVGRVAMSMGKIDAQGRPDMVAWLAEVEQRQNLPSSLYRYDVVWPSAALLKMTASKAQVTPDDIRKAYDANYGARVRCRAIVMGNQRQAQEVWDMARRNPTVDQFGILAEQYSIEAASRSLKGEIPPIQRYSGRDVLEKEAFALKPGELSGVIQVSDKFIILFCEGYTQPLSVDMKEVEPILRDEVREKKLHALTTEYFAKIQESATIDNFLAKTSQSPQRAPSATGSLQRAGNPALKPAPGQAKGGAPIETRPGAIRQTSTLPPRK